MTNICCIGSVIDEQSRESVPVEVGRNRDNNLHFSFRGVAWEPTPKEFRLLQRVLQAIQWRLSVVARRGRRIKEGSREIGPFTVGLNDDGAIYVGTPTRYVYLDENSLEWMIAALRQALAPPPRAVQLAVQSNWEFERERYD